MPKKCGKLALRPMIGWHGLVGAFRARLQAWAWLLLEIEIDEEGRCKGGWVSEVPVKSWRRPCLGC